MRLHSSLFLAALLGACTASAPAPAPLDSAVLPPPPGQLAASLSSSLEPGERSEMLVAGATPGDRVFLVFSTRGEGAGPCPAVLGGDCLGVVGAQLLSSEVAGADGIARFRLNVPGNVRNGIALSTQAVVIGGGGAVFSNVRTDIVGPERPVSQPTVGAPVALSEGGRIVVTNRTAHTIQVMDADLVGSDATPVAELDVPGARPWATVLDNAGNTAWVALRGTGEVARIDNLDGVPVLHPVRALVDGEPTGIAISPNGTTLYVPNWTAGTVSVIDGDSMEVFDTLDLNAAIAGSGLLGPSVSAQGRPGLARPFAIAITDDGDSDDDDEQIYVTEFFGQDDPTADPAVLGDAFFDVRRQGVVYTIDAATHTVGDLITLAPVAETDFLDSVGNNTGCFPNQLQAMAINNDRVYVTSVCASPLGPAGGGGANARTKVHGLLSVIDTATQTEIVGERVLLTRAWQDLYDGLGVADDASRRFPLIPNGITFFPNTNIAYLTAYGADAVFRLEFGTDGSLAEVGAPIRTFINLADPTHTGRLPMGLAIPGFPRALVANENTRNLSFIDLSVQAVANAVPTADPPAPGAETDANTGQRFFVTGLARWSLNGQAWNSCEGCHPGGLTDNVSWFFPTGPRQTVSLDGSFDGTGEQRIFNWTAVRDEVTDFELNTRGISGGVGALVHTLGPLSAEQRIIFDGTQNAGSVSTLDSQANLNGSTEEVMFGDLDGVDANGDPILISSVLDDWDLITQWIETVDAPKAPRNLDPADVADGRTLFTTAGCAGCHGGEAWTISERFYTPDQVTSGVGGLLDTTTYDRGTLPPSLNPFSAAGPVPLRDGGEIKCVLRDVGTYPNAGVDGVAPADVVVSERRQDMVTPAAGVNGFNPPSLLGAGVGAPYFHGGNARTLEEVFDPAFTPHTRALSAVFTPSRAQIRKLTAFLSSIDEDTPPLANTVTGTTTVLCPDTLP